MRPLVLVVSDSRGKKFGDLYQEFQDGGNRYEFDHICVRGAKINDLIEPTIERVKDEFSKRYIIIKLAAGINDLTKKEIGLANITPQEVFRKLTYFKTCVKEYHRRSVISYCTVAPANLVAQQSHAVSVGRYHKHRSEEELRRLTGILIETIRDLNENINTSHKNKQYGVAPQIVALHKPCLRFKGKPKLIPSSLSDGLHGTESTQRTWMEKIIKAVNTEVDELLKAETNTQDL